MEEEQTRFVETIFERVEAYGQTTIELSKLRALDMTTTVVTSLIARLSVVVLLASFIFILNIGLALWIGDKLGKSYYGFFVVAGLYLLAAVWAHFYLLHRIKKPLSAFIIGQAFQ